MISTQRCLVGEGVEKMTRKVKCKRKGKLTIGSRNKYSLNDLKKGLKRFERRTNDVGLDIMQKFVGIDQIGVYAGKKECGSVCCTACKTGHVHSNSGDRLDSI